MTKEVSLEFNEETQREQTTQTTQLPSTRTAKLSRGFRRIAAERNDTVISISVNQSIRALRHFFVGVLRLRLCQLSCVQKETNEIRSVNTVNELRARATQLNTQQQKLRLYSSQQ